MGLDVEILQSLFLGEMQCTAARRTSDLDDIKNQCVDRALTLYKNGTCEITQ